MMKTRILMAAGLAVTAAAAQRASAPPEPTHLAVEELLDALLGPPSPELRRNPVQPPLPDRSPYALATPGNDTCLAMSWEPTVAVDPNNPMVIAVSQFLTIQVSFDGGDTIGQTINASVPAGWCAGGDPSLAFDSQGRLFLTYLGSPPPQPGESCSTSTTPGREVFITGYQPTGPGGTFVQIPAVNWPVSVSGSAGLPAPNNADKEWLAADANPGSPFTDRLYVVWPDLDQSPWRIYVAYSSNQGQNWQLSSPGPISQADEGPRPWPPHIAVAPNGDVYVAYHSQPGFLDANFRVPDGVSGQIVLRRSTDGGSNFGARSFPFGPGDADMTWNVQHLANGVIPGATFWLQGSSQPWILPDPAVPGVVSVVANDDPDDDVDSGDAADVFIAVSDDFGQNWTDPPIRVDNGPAGTFQVLPTAAIDPQTGAIAVTYYDNRALSDMDNDGNWDLDLLLTYSFDGGFSWQPEVDVNDGLFDPQGTTSCRFCCSASDACFGQPMTMRIGEYNGVAYGECTAYMVWADNESCGSGGSMLDTFFDRDPDAGGDDDPPTIDCPANVSVGCNDPTDPAATGMATATDGCDLDPVISHLDFEESGDCPPGTVISSITRTWSATDAAGNVATCDQVISIVDFDPPVVTAPPPLVLECNTQGGVSGDDPQIVTWLAQADAVDECSEAVLTDTAPDFFPSGCAPGAETQVIFTGIDGCGNSDFAVSSVTVQDTTEPTVSCAVDIDTLWPPNHGLVDVGFSYEALDICDPDPAISITVTSDEHPAEAPGAGGPLHCPDAIITDDGAVLLRRERSGGGDGRVYEITITATDNCGNAASCSVQVTVRHNPGQPAVDSGQAFDATDCDA